jgi:hypothetical protein
MHILGKDDEPARAPSSSSHMKNKRIIVGTIPLLRDPAEIGKILANARLLDPEALLSSDYCTHAGPLSLTLPLHGDPNATFTPVPASSTVHESSGSLGTSEVDATLAERLMRSCPHHSQQARPPGGPPPPLRPDPPEAGAGTRLPAALVLFINSRSHPEQYVLPKGGVHRDEPICCGALRETWEEAGVTGRIDPCVRPLRVESPKDVGYWFDLIIDRIYQSWPEQDERTRIYVRA